MRSAKRAIVATALGLPLMIGAPAMALADGHHDGGKPCHSKKCHGDSQEQEQEQEATTEQSNTNVSPIYQWNIGSKGEQNAVNWVDQTNASSTEQNAGAWEFDD
ncbi:hypothetical protein ABT324_21990 [Saccharopolyspora sp. NPDC000359]|uniref:hypothetical protein n=1 Tax=Saccharopolyspora sp. NPDC000359 TaxID=3154251 RepID=UPI003316E714